MKKIEISRQQVRRFILAHQRLLPPRTISGKEEILDFFERVGCIQFDPLNIVGTNPELVLQSRVSGFKAEILDEMLYSDRTLIDGWDKMMAIYPVTDWPYFIYRQREAAKHSSMRNAEHTIQTIPEVRRAVQERGPLASIDLDHDKKVPWPWGPARLAKVVLDEMYYQGELIIHHKVNTRKIYDLASRHIPEEILNAPDPHLTMEEYHDWHFLRRLRSVGLVWDRSGIWPWIHGADSKVRTRVLKRLVKQDRAVEVQIEDIRYPFYMAVQDLEMLNSVKDTDNKSGMAAVIAPLDNLMWDREMIKELFGFSYRWEVYKPIKEREYGYYVLPVLGGDRFVARFEPGRDRKTGALEIKNWWWEEGIIPTEEMRSALRDCFSDFLGYLGAGKIKVKKKLVDRERLGWLP